jgi:hypothetical protein
MLGVNSVLQLPFSDQMNVKSVLFANIKLFLLLYICRFVQQACFPTTGCSTTVSYNRLFIQHGFSIIGLFSYNKFLFLFCLQWPWLPLVQVLKELGDVLVVKYWLQDAATSA